MFLLDSGVIDLQDGPPAAADEGDGHEEDAPGEVTRHELLLRLTAPELPHLKTQNRFIATKAQQIFVISPFFSLKFFVFPGCRRV